jgi:copper(I)-binding protein
LLRKSRGTTVARRVMIGAIALLVPALAGCEAGFNAPTLQFHPASNGAHDVVNGISINNVFVLGPATGATLPVGSSAGLFLALYNGGGSGDTLTGASAPGTATSVKLEQGPVGLSPNTSVLLTGPRPELVLTGLTTPLSGGTTITVKLDFANAGTVTLQVPVEPHAFYFDMLSPAPSPSPSSTATATAKATTRATTKATASSTATPSTTASPSTTPSTSPSAG